MDLTIGSLELNRTHPAHVGSKPLLDGSKPLYMDAAGNLSNTVREVREHGSFEGYLLDAVTAMNDQQVGVDRLQEQLITDPDNVDIHDVTIAMAKAQMSMNLAQTVIDRVISGWNDLSQNR